MKFLANKVPYRVPVMDGGLQTKWTDDSAPDYMSPALQQIQYTDVGAAGLAPGYIARNTTSMGSAPVDGLWSYYNSVSGAEEIVAVCNNNVYASTSTAFVAVSGGTGVFTGAVDVCMRTVTDEVFLTNGRAYPHRYDGDALYTVGVPTTLLSGTAAAVVGNTAGSMTSTAVYQYALSGLNSNSIEGSIKTITTGITLPTGYNNIALSGIPEWPTSAGVTTTKYLYRNTAGVEGLYYRVTALSAGQTSYVDTAADSSLSTSAQTDNGAMPACQFCWFHRGRLFAAGDPIYPSRLYYSQAGQPEIWPALNFLDIGAGDGMSITGIRVMGNSVTVHKTDSTGAVSALWLVYMPDSTEVVDATNWYIIKSPAAYASRSDKAIDFFENLMAYLDRRGLIAFTGEQVAPGPATAQIGQYLSETRSDNIEPDIHELKSSLLSKAAMIAYDDKLWLAVASGPTAFHNNTIYVYDYTITSQERGQGAWSKLVPMSINNFAVHHGGLIAGSATDGIVYNMDTGYSANGADLDSYLYTMWITGDKKHWDATKVWRFLWLTIDTPGSWDLSVTWWVDKAATETGSTVVSLTGGGSEWDHALWDGGLWDSSTDRRTIRINLAGCVGRSIQFRFETNSQDVWWAIYRMEVEYNLRSRRD